METTREEAKEVLKDIVSKPMLFSNHIIDACRVALASLEAENDLGVDCISRKAVLELLEDTNNGWIINEVLQLPSVTPQEPQSFKWCRDCKEYDQDKHCCHRWSKVIRDTVEEMKQEQESRKGYLSIDDVMSVFDDFMCGEVDEEGIETFWEMLKDKAESEDKE